MFLLRTDGRADVQKDIGDSRVAFATENITGQAKAHDKLLGLSPVLARIKVLGQSPSTTRCPKKTGHYCYYYK